MGSRGGEVAGSAWGKSPTTPESLLKVFPGYTQVFFTLCTTGAMQDRGVEKGVVSLYKSVAQAYLRYPLGSNRLTGYGSFLEP